MATDKKAPIADPAALLEGACARNTPLELFRRVGDASLPVARARMLDIDGELIYLEEPQTIGMDVRINAGDPLTAFFSRSEALLCFHTTVKSRSCPVRLNARKVVQGMTIRRPANVKPGQRREYFRTSLATQDPIPVRMHEASSQEPATCPIGALRYEGRLVDGSGSGLGVRIDGENCSKFKRFRLFFVTFCVPGTEHRLDTLCEVRQARPILDGHAVRIGMFIHPWPTQRHLTRQIQPFLRYLVEVQRRVRRSA